LSQFNIPDVFIKLREDFLFRSLSVFHILQLYYMTSIIWFILTQRE